MNKNWIILLIIVASLLVIYMWRHGPGNMPHISGGPHMMGGPMHGSGIAGNIALPQEHSEEAKKGKKLFEANCVICHGQNAMGQTGNGPPLIHKIYEPNHHADEAFQRAVANGVRAHHWPFGNMPAIPGLSREDVSSITKYIREIQQVNGIN